MASFDGVFDLID